jgi:hypothetical protein
MCTVQTITKFCEDDVECSIRKICREILNKIENKIFEEGIIFCFIIIFFQYLIVFYVIVVILHEEMSLYIH